MPNELPRYCGISRDGTEEAGGQLGNNSDSRSTFVPYAAVRFPLTASMDAGLAGRQGAMQVEVHTSRLVAEGR